MVDTDGEGSLLRDRGAFAAFKNNLKRNYKEIMKASDEKGVHHIYDAVGGPIINTVIKWYILIHFNLILKHLFNLIDK